MINDDQHMTCSRQMFRAQTISFSAKTCCILVSPEHVHTNEPMDAFHAEGLMELGGFDTTGNYRKGVISYTPSNIIGIKFRT